MEEEEAVSVPKGEWLRAEQKGTRKGVALGVHLSHLDMDLETIWAVSIAGHLELGNNNGEKKWCPQHHSSKTT